MSLTISECLNVLESLALTPKEREAVDMAIRAQQHQTEALDGAFRGGFERVTMIELVRIMGRGADEMNMSILLLRNYYAPALCRSPAVVLTVPAPEEL